MTFPKYSVPKITIDDDDYYLLTYPWIVENSSKIVLLEIVTK